MLPQVQKKVCPCDEGRKLEEISQTYMCAGLTPVALDPILEEVKIVIFSKWQVGTVGVRSSVERLE